MRQVTRSMSNIVVAMDRAMKEMNLEKVCGHSLKLIVFR